jgi:hypothetical protein
MRWRHLLVVLGSVGVISTLAVAAEPPADDRWAFAAAERPDGRPPLTSHRDVAGLLGAMLAGDAAVMFRDPPRFQSLSIEQFKALRVTFAAQDAQLAMVARLLTRWLRGRVVFVPRSPGDHLTLTLQDVRFDEVAAALAGLGDIQVLAPAVRPSQTPTGDAPQPLTLPPAHDFNPGKGLIDGKAAVGLWPGTSSAMDRKAADPTGFEAHIALRDALDTETVHPAGEWFIPSLSGVFLVWLENPARYLISPSPTPLMYHLPPPDAKQGLALVDRVVSAGRVRLDSPTCDGNCTLGLLHANSHIGAGGSLRPEMKRLVSESVAVERGALMPAGAVAATLYDKVVKEYRAVEAPIAVASDQTAVLRPKPPSPGFSDLVVVLTRPKLLDKATDEDAMPQLVLASGKSPVPVFAASGPMRLYAIWKGVASGKATLQLHSKTLRLPQPDVMLRPGHVESVEAVLVPLPRLGVRIELPEELRRGPLQVSIEPSRVPASPVTQTVAANAERAEFLHVPAALLRVSVVAVPWELDDTVDMSSGQDAEITLRAQLITLDGIVYYGSEPRQARVMFRTNHGDDEVSVETDAKGHYHIVLARPGGYLVMVQFDDRGRPYLVLLDVPGSGRQDFKVPGNDFRIRVVRSDTGAPIPKADVAVHNTGSDQFTQGFSVKTGDDGVAHAMPLRPGEVDIGAKAPHFGTAEFKDKVPEGDFSREITLSLKPLEGTPVALVLSSGQPALGAEVWVRSSDSTPILSADETGRVSLPDSAVGTPLLVRAPGAASGFVLWDGQAESIALGPPGPPLTIAARKQSGDPAAWARLALWIDGTRFSGETLQWAFNAQPVDRNGVTTLQGLPPHPLDVLLWSPDQRISGLAEAGAYDSQRTTVAFPWPSVATVTAVQ